MDLFAEIYYHEWYYELVISLRHSPSFGGNFGVLCECLIINIMKNQ
jgi:hypothetical protein